MWPRIGRVVKSRHLTVRYRRVALAVRDRGCVFVGCERPAAWSEAHHIVAWHDGGPTDINQRCLLCSFHHLIHHGQWSAVMAADGTPEIIPPARINPDRTPLRHQRFKPRRE